jgi:hypothetical protein
MNNRINAVLENIRATMEGEGDDATAYGPSVSGDVGGATNADAEAGAGGAVNPSDVSNTLDLYLSEISDLLTLEYGKNENEAMNFVFSAASALAREGVIPEVPSDSATDDEVAQWLGKAKSVQFASHVLNRAREMSK